MIDDYIYKSQQLTELTGQFGYGGSPNSSSRGFRATSVDVGSGYATGNTSQRSRVSEIPIQAEGNGVTIPSAPSSGTYVLGSISGEIQWIETTDC